MINKLVLKSREECKYDMLSLGEVMLRMDPGEGRIRTARSFRVWEGGGEYNVARALHKCFDMKTGIMTAIADNEVGLLIKDLIEQGGVCTDLIAWKETDGVGKKCRNGINFTERGFGIRGALSCSDRANTAISQATIEDFDFEYIFGTLGVRWFHTGGIMAALSPESQKLVIEACKIAKKYGTIVSYDLNYRASLWDLAGGIDECVKVNREIAKYADVVIGSEEDYVACLGYEVEGADEGFKELNVDAFKKMLTQVATDFPNIKILANMLHTVRTASINDWKVLCLADGDICMSREYEGLEVLDRVGIGDSFAAGFVYGLMTSEDPELAVNYGAAHGALAMTTPGDTSMARLSEVEAIMNAAGARVKR
ncbi:MAG: sugar kinase [Eubacterium sp.]|nr:sugar kinase [Eubacterium sp.]